MKFTSQRVTPVFSPAAGLDYFLFGYHQEACRSATRASRLDAARLEFGADA